MPAGKPRLGGGSTETRRIRGDPGSMSFPPPPTQARGKEKTKPCDYPSTCIAARLRADAFGAANLEPLGIAHTAGGLHWASSTSTARMIFRSRSSWPITGFPLTKIPGVLFSDPIQVSASSLAVRTLVFGNTPRWSLRHRDCPLPGPPWCRWRRRGEPVVAIAP
uniref:Uncharacterized protein n=1 Tax=Candidatus Kentrum sp. LFY TaxID=2126342 RepID=A0A450WTM4_9GAMM|nr:MAG: hypothetical protein BECKLFY1418C_GA0070996_107112 [Candidatus Kentron sp. LFY]